MAPHFDLVVFGDMEHTLFNIKIAISFEQQIEPLQGNVVELQRILKRNVLNSGQVGVDSFIEHTRFACTQIVLEVQAAHHKRMSVTPQVGLDFLIENTLVGQIDWELDQSTALETVLPDVVIRT